MSTHSHSLPCCNVAQHPWDRYASPGARMICARERCIVAVPCGMISGVYTKRTRTRITLLTAALRDDGRSYVAAAQMAQVHRVTVWRWRKLPHLRRQLTARRPPSRDAMAGAWALVRAHIARCPTCGRESREPP
jgi:hypothetical protein